MSNIIQSKKDFLIFDEFFNKDLTKANTEELLKELMPSKNNDPLIRYCVRESFGRTAAFVPAIKRIDITIKRLDDILNKYAQSFSEEIKSCDSDTLRRYFYIQIISHELEHANQYLMGEGILEAPNDVIKEAYKGLFDIILPSKDYIIPRPISMTMKLVRDILYDIKKNYYLLERNAQIESMDLVSQYALYRNRDDVFKFFTYIKDIISRIGYTNSNIGSIEETYKKLLMHNKYKKFYKELDLSTEDRIRYGFGITDEEKQVLIKKTS